jgi:NAD(P)H-quinone oxidoreductase subunit 5
MITVFLTAFYMFRAWFLAFFGPYRGGAQGSGVDTHASDAREVSHDAHAAAHDPHAPGAAAAVVHGSGHGGHGGTPHESPPVMTIPLLILLVPTIISGFWILLGNASFSAFLEGHDEGFHFDPISGGLSIVLAVFGIALAYLIYGSRAMRPLSLPGYALLQNRYYLDAVYARFVDWLIHRGSQLVTVFDAIVIDGIVNAVGRLAVGAGSAVRAVQSGRVQGYAMVVFGGLLIIMVFTTLLPLLGIGAR